MHDWRHAGERPKCQPEISHSTSVAPHLLPHPLEYGVPESSWPAGDGVCEDRQADRKDWFVDEEGGVRILWHKLWGLRGGGTSSSVKFERRWDNYLRVPKSPRPVALMSRWFVIVVGEYYKHSQHSCNTSTWMTFFTFPELSVCLSSGNLHRETSPKLV